MLEIKNVTKRFNHHRVLDHISLELPDVGMIAIVGDSGCGKSTLLHIMGGLDPDFSGKVLFDGKDIYHSRFRNKHVSYIFQSLYLINWLNMKDNMFLSSFFRKTSNEKEIAMIDFKNDQTRCLSLGQKQRLAYNRSILSNHKVLLCDEPTGSLDEYNSKVLMNRLKEESMTSLVVIVSHDLQTLENYCDKIIYLKDGHVINQKVLHALSSNRNTTNDNTSFVLKWPKLYMKYMIKHIPLFKKTIISLVLSLVCILLTFSMSSSLQEVVNNYIDSIVPASSISLNNVNGNLTVGDLKQIDEKEVIKRQLFINGYDFMGIGFKGDRYNEKEVLFINDDNAPINHLNLKYGKLPSKNHEVVVSLNTAESLCNHKPINKLVGKKVYGWYHHDNKMVNIAYKIVGISSNNTPLTTLYTLENSYIDLLEIPNEEKVGHLAILYIDKTKDINQCLSQLKSNYPHYSFKITGQSTHQKINEKMKMVERIITIFSVLTSLSSLFLIGEITYYMGIQKKKDYAIMTCFGGSKLHYLAMGMLEVLILLVCSSVLVLLFDLGFVSIVNTFTSKILLNDTFKIIFDFKQYLQVISIGMILLVLSECIPIVSMLNMNISYILKDSSNY